MRFFRSIKLPSSFLIVEFARAHYTVGRKKMSNSRAFKTTPVLLLLVTSLFLTGFKEETCGEETVSVEYETMLTKSCYAENVNILSENIVEINQCGCCPPPGPYICIGCLEYSCIGLYSYASMISDSCWLLAFCFFASDCQALCVSLIPEPPPFK